MLHSCLYAVLQKPSLIILYTYRERERERELVYTVWSAVKKYSAISKRYVRHMMASSKQPLLSCHSASDNFPCDCPGRAGEAKVTVPWDGANHLNNRRKAAKLCEVVMSTGWILAPTLAKIKAIKLLWNQISIFGSCMSSFFGTSSWMFPWSRSTWASAPIHSWSICRRPAVTRPAADMSGSGQLVLMTWGWVAGNGHGR